MDFLKEKTIAQNTWNQNSFNMAETKTLNLLLGKQGRTVLLKDGKHSKELILNQTLGKFGVFKKQECLSVCSIAEYTLSFSWQTSKNIQSFPILKLENRNILFSVLEVSSVFLSSRISNSYLLVMLIVSCFFPCFNSIASFCRYWEHTYFIYLISLEANFAFVLVIHDCLFPSVFNF